MTTTTKLAPPPSRARHHKAARMLVDNPRQLEALTLPVRLELVDTVSALGPMSVGDMARSVGRKRESLYFHVARLEEVGLLREVGERETERRNEALYDTPARAIGLRLVPGDEANVEAHIQAASSNLRLTLRDLPGAFRPAGGPPVRPRGARRNLRVSRVKGWLSGPDLERANALLGELEALVNAGERKRGARLFTLTLALLAQPGEEVRA